MNSQDNEFKIQSGHLSIIEYFCPITSFAMAFFETLKQWDKDLFLFINDIHSPFMDGIMFYVTDKEIWFPFYAIILGIMVWKLKWQTLPIVIGLILVIGISDQITSGIMKPFFQRLRPCHQTGIKEIVHMVNGCGAIYGFASSHASNSFGFALFFWLTTRKWWKYSAWIIAWAILVSYSRIYVGVHYPGDILVGAMVGIIFAFGVYEVYKKVLPKIKLPGVVYDE